MHRAPPFNQELRGVYGVQELDEPVTDLSRGFVLHPVAHIIDFEMAHETGEAGAELLRRWIEALQAIHLSRNEKRRLGDLGVFPSAGKIEIWLGGAIVVKATVETGALELGDIMRDVIRISPRWQRPRSRTIKASCRIQRIPPFVGWSRTRCPIQNTRNGNSSIGPNMIGLWSHLFEHVEIVLMPGITHFLEGADVPAGNVRHADAE